MDAKEKERIKKIILSLVAYGQELTASMIREIASFPSIAPFSILIAIYRLNTNTPPLDLVQRTGEEGFRLLRDVILLSEALQLSSDPKALRITANAVQRALDSKEEKDVLPDISDLAAFTKVSSALFKYRAQKLTADLMLPLESAYDVAFHAVNIDPKLLGITK